MAKIAKIRDCINTHDQIAAAHEVGMLDVAIFPHMIPSSSRSGSHFQSGWHVLRIGKNISDPRVKAAWYEDQNVRIFSEHPHGREAALAAAMNWVNDRYKPTNWKRNRHRAWIAEEVNKAFPLLNPRTAKAKSGDEEL